MSAVIEYDNIVFENVGEEIRLRLMGSCLATLSRDELEAIAPCTVRDGALVFEGISEKKAANKMNRILDDAFRRLIFEPTKKPITYVHEGSGIPLMGTLAFGIVDRGTDMLEIKPVTGCNINCTFCSVDEGISSTKTTDVIVDADYLISQTRNLLEFKGHNGIDIYLNPHGDPTLYADLAHLIKGIRELPQVRVVTMITNAVLLSESYLDELFTAGLNRINISISAIDDLPAKKTAGFGKYDVKHVMKMIEYCSQHIETYLGPVWLPGVNDEQIEKVVAWAKDLPVTIGIQNFLPYKGGRNPVEGVSMESFFSFLKQLEKKYEVNLTSFNYQLVSTKELSSPFRKDDVVKAQIMMPGRYPAEKIAVASERCITVRGCRQESGNIKVKIVRAKNNVFLGVPV